MITIISYMYSVGICDVVKIGSVSFYNTHRNSMIKMAQDNYVKEERPYFQPKSNSGNEVRMLRR